jgi:hypothetical protein
VGELARHCRAGGSGQERRDSLQQLIGWWVLAWACGVTAFVFLYGETITNTRGAGSAALPASAWLW